MLENYAAILAYISERIKTTYCDTEAADFVDRHSSVIAPLALVSKGTRRVTGSGAGGLLSEDEKIELKGACADFGMAWKARYYRPLTPKGHIVVAHVPWFVDEYGICGVFGEDGCEALHVSDSLCRNLVRPMRDPEARHKAHTLHHTARSFIPDLDRKPGKHQKRGDVAPGACARGGGGSGQ